MKKQVKMGKKPCYDKERVKRGAWTPEEDAKLIQHIKENGHGRWRNLPNQAGLVRCGKSCRLRWKNYLRPDIRRGAFTPEEEATIMQLHGLIGNKWVAIASNLPGRTDNEIKNCWNTRLRKRLMSQNEQSSNSSIIKFECPSTRHMVQWESVRVQAEARLSMKSLQLNSSLEDNKHDSDDIFLRLWNSQVGESFRETTRKGGECANAISHSSLEELESYSFVPSAENVMPGSDSISSNELTDSSDSALNLLLDFPRGYVMEMESLCEQTDTFSNLFDLQCDRNCQSPGLVVS